MIFIFFRHRYVWLPHTFHYLSISQISASEPLESPEFLEKSNIDISTLKEEAYKEVLWYSNHSH